MLSWQLLLALLVLLWIYVLWSRRKYYRLMREIPGPMGYPLIGMAHKLMRREDIIAAFNNEHQKYGPTFYSWLGPYPFMVISDPQIAQDILTSPYCINKSFIYDVLDDGAGCGLFSLKNPQWAVHRKLLNPAFGHKVLQTFLPIFNEEMNVLLKTCETLTGKGPVDLTKILQACTLNISIQTTMGTNLADNKEGLYKKQLLSNYYCVLANMTEMLFSPWMNFKIVQCLKGTYAQYSEAKREVRKFITKLINEKLPLELPPEDKNIFINRAIELLKSGDFQWKNVQDECNVIVFGAFETTANTIYYTLMLLAMFPEYQQKLYEELLSLFPTDGAFDVSYADTQQMIYMDLVLNEAMRLIAPVPFVARENSHEVILSNGTVLPAGIQIAINIFNMHRRADIWGPDAHTFNPDHFLPTNFQGKHPYAFIPFTKGIRNCIDIWGPDAHTFNPDHFLPTNFQGKHPYAFIPFTKGIRNCIGWRYAFLSTKIALTKLLRNYHFTTNFPFEELHFVEDITIKLKKIPLLEIHKRNK